MTIKLEIYQDGHRWYWKVPYAKHGPFLTRYAATMAMLRAAQSLLNGTMEVPRLRVVK